MTRRTKSSLSGFQKSSNFSSNNRECGKSIKLGERARRFLYTQFFFQILSRGIQLFFLHGEISKGRNPQKIKIGSDFPKRNLPVCTRWAVLLATKGLTIPINGSPCRVFFQPQRLFGWQRNSFLLRLVLRSRDVLKEGDE